MEDSTTNQELGGRMGKIEEKVNEIEKSVAAGFSKISLELEKINNSISLQAANNQIEFDKRYSTRSEALENAMSRLDNPEYCKKLFSVMDDWAESDHGCEKLSKAYSYFIDKGRDNATKWINFVKLILGIAISFTAVYGGGAIVKTQKDNQKAMSAIMQTLERK